MGRTEDPAQVPHPVLCVDRGPGAGSPRRALWGQSAPGPPWGTQRPLPLVPLPRPGRRL